jgi:ribosome recycling factor
MHRPVTAESASSNLVVLAEFFHFKKELVYHEGVNQEILDKMERTIQCLEESIRCIRLGTVTSSFVDTFKVSYYGQQMPIKHLAQTSNERGLVMVKPNDPMILGAIQKTLKDAGLNAYIFSKQAVAVSVPPICGEERERVKARVKVLGEDTKIAIRNIRKAHRKSDKSLSEDEKRKFEKEIQEFTDRHIALVDEIVNHKLDVLSK